jgi:hypothetical protein
LKKDWCQMGLIFKICDSGHEIQLPYKRQTQKKKWWSKVLNHQKLKNKTNSNQKLWKWSWLTCNLKYEIGITLLKEKNKNHEFEGLVTRYQMMKFEKNQFEKRLMLNGVNLQNLWLGSWDPVTL